eukprot:gnl/MRDRNA2_/MRDRNA2_78029_c0_seq4.p1 gnl/MRDRNA2_/MRDRNA2_78029_c0~~gnl/MRDRNA2_/MRDRNA2_78029_c0_seq4.p1  ORF type:complete len:162 (-),score=45.95 gnl/MRDRNA2_/MRDRNA2_78029_c0_seq4:145-630(-)
MCNRSKHESNIAEMSLGIFELRHTSFDSQEIVQRTDYQQVSPRYRSVALGKDKDHFQNYILPERQPDDSEDLAKRVMEQLGGGDAVIEVCQGSRQVDEGVKAMGGQNDPAQMQSQSGGQHGKIQVDISLNIAGGKVQVGKTSGGQVVSLAQSDQSPQKLEA